jgi:hypothetical protein
VSTQTVEHAAAGLLFNWSHGRSRKLMIAGFIALSLAAHALCFYLFQIVYPPTVALLPPPARVSMIVPDSEEGRTLLNWLEAEDPALVSTTQRPPDVKAFTPPRVQHVPSYTIVEPALRELPPYTPDLRIPSSRPPGPVPSLRAHPQRAPVAAPTVVRFSEELEALGTFQKPEVRFVPSTKEPPQNARFHVAVTTTGEVRHVFLDRSSGDPALDEQARQCLILCRFTTDPANPVAGNDLTWGSAMIQWGNDIVRDHAASPSPAP